MRRLKKFLLQLAVSVAALLAFGGIGYALISSGVLVLQAGTGSAITFNTNGATTRGQITSAGSFIANNGDLATNATDGFVYIPNSAGAPSGTPTVVNGIPFIADSTNSAVYFYTNSAWHQINAIAGDTTWPGTFKTYLSTQIAPTGGTHLMSCIDYQWNMDYELKSNTAGLNFYTTNNGAGATSTPILSSTDNTLSGVVYRLDTSATASKTAQLILVSTSAGPPTGVTTGWGTVIGNGKHKWGMCSLFRVPTAVDAQTTATTGIITVDGVTTNLSLGVIGSNSTTVYSGSVAFAATTTLSSTVAVDTGWHTCCYADDSSTSAISCDKETWVTGTLRTPNNSKSLEGHLTAKNGTTAAVRRLDVSEMLICYSGQ